MLKGFIFVGSKARIEEREQRDEVILNEMRIGREGTERERYAERPGAHCRAQDTQAGTGGSFSGEECKQSPRPETLLRH